MYPPFVRKIKAEKLNGPSLVNLLKAISLCANKSLTELELSYFKIGSSEVAAQLGQLICKDARHLQSLILIAMLKKK